MALSQDEQRILAEIERRLANDDPGLASSLTAFRRPGPAKMLRRSPRVRIIGSLFTVLLVAMVSLTVYAMIPFRAHMPAAPTTAAGPTNTALSAATSSQPSATAAILGQPRQRQRVQRQRVQRQPGQPEPLRRGRGDQQAAAGQAKPTSTAMLPTTNP